MLTRKLPDCMSEPPVETRKIHTNNHVRLSVQRQLEQLVEQSPEFEIVSDDIIQADHRMLGHVKSQLNACGRHPGTARAKKNRRQRSVERLKISGRNCWCVRKF